MAKANQNPEQKARDNIDRLLEEAGWKVQSKKALDFNAGQGIAVREYDTDIGPADYALFVDRKAVGVIEAKPEDWGQKITTVEEQSGTYAAAKLKWVNNKEPLPFVYESTGIVTRFTDSRDPKPRSREVFTFHRPETMAEWLSKPKSLRARLHDIPVLNQAGLSGVGHCLVGAHRKQPFDNHGPEKAPRISPNSLNREPNFAPYGGRFARERPREMGIACHVSAHGRASYRTRWRRASDSNPR